MFDFAEEMYFDEKSLGKKITGNRRLIRLLQSLNIIASWISTRSSSSKSNDLCDGLKLLLQEKQAGNNSDKINQEIIAIADKHS